MGNKEKFLKIYANLPLPEREQVIAVIEGETYSWNVAYKEISENTKLGDKILKRIEVVGLL